MLLFWSHLIAGIITIYLVSMVYCTWLLFLQPLYAYQNYIAVHIWKNKWWLLRPLVISLCISDDLVDEESLYAGSPGSFKAQQEESKYFFLIFNISILFSCHCGYMYYHLRWNPPDVGVTSGQKSSTKIIYIVLQTSVGLF